MAEIKTFDPMETWRALAPETQQMIGALAIANEVAFLATDQAIDADAAYWLHERTHSSAGDALADLIADNLPAVIFAASSDYPLRPDLNACGIRQCTGCGCTDDHACEAGVGMCLFVFDEHAGEPRANYISNCRREQTLTAVKEWVSRQETASS